MEGTAAWMEDELFDGVNDNLQYLVESPLRNRACPSTTAADDYGPYGAWVFWQYLSEWAGAGAERQPAHRARRLGGGGRLDVLHGGAAEGAGGRAQQLSGLRAPSAPGTREPARYFSEGSDLPGQRRSTAGSR